MHTDGCECEITLISEAQKGDREAMQHLIEQHRLLIYALSRRIQAAYIDKDELVQAGILGFMQAVKRYQIGREAKLTTYAVPWILGEMKKTLRSECSHRNLLSLDQEDHKDSFSLQKALCGARDVDLNIIDLRMACEKLSPDAQELICLRFFRGKTQKETALLLKKSQAWVSRLEAQSLDLLREFLS